MSAVKAARKRKTIVKRSAPGGTNRPGIKDAGHPVATLPQVVGYSVGVAFAVLAIVLVSVGFSLEFLSNDRRWLLHHCLCGTSALSAAGFTGAVFTRFKQRGFLVEASFGFAIWFLVFLLSPLRNAAGVAPSPAPPPPVVQPMSHEDLLFDQIQTEILSGDFEHARSNRHRLPAMEQRAVKQAGSIDSLKRLTRKQELMCIEPEAFCWNIALDALFLRFIDRVGVVSELDKIPDSSVTALLTPEERNKIEKYSNEILERCSTFQSYVTELATLANSDADAEKALVWLNVTNRDSQIQERIGFEKCMALSGLMLIGKVSENEVLMEVNRQRAEFPGFWADNPIENQDLLGWAWYVISEG